MDWKTFLASLVGSLAWPSAVAASLFLFRKEVAHLLGQVRKIAAGGVNLEIAQQVERAISAAERVEDEKGVAAPDVIGLDPRLLDLAQSFPEAAVLQSFKEIESVLLQIRTLLPDGRPHRNLTEVMKVLLDKKYISGSEMALFQSLREARNAAAHKKAADKLTPSESVQLIRQMKLLEQLLVQVANQLLNPQPPTNS